MLMSLKKQSESKEPKHIEHEQSRACVVCECLARSVCSLEEAKHADQALNPQVSYGILREGAGIKGYIGHISFSFKFS